MTTITAYTASQMRSAPSAPSTTRSPNDDRLDALARLSSALNADLENAKSAATERLKRVKEQIEYLKRWGFPPQTIMRQAAQLGHELASAANSFAAATGASGSPASTVTAQPSNGSDTADQQTTMPMGYQDVVDDNAGPKPLSKADRATTEGFISVARQLRQLIEEARRKLQAAQAENAGAAGKTLDDTVAGLTRMLDTPAETFAGLSTVMPAL